MCMYKFIQKQNLKNIITRNMIYIRNIIYNYKQIIIGHVMKKQSLKVSLENHSPNRRRGRPKRGRGDKDHLTSPL